MLPSLRCEGRFPSWTLLSFSSMMGLSPCSSLLICLLSLGGAVTAAVTTASATVLSAEPQLSLLRLVNQQINSSLARHNTSGALPPLPALNLLMKQANGDTALSFAQDANGGIVVLGLPTSVPSLAAPRVNGAANTRALTTQPGFTPNITDPSSIFPATPPPPPPQATFGMNAGPASIAAGALPPPSPMLDLELVTAVRAVRFGLYDALYGYLEFAGYQLLAVGELVTIQNVNAGLAILAAGNELLSFGYLAQGSGEHTHKSSARGRPTHSRSADDYDYCYCSLCYSPVPSV